MLKNIDKRLTGDVLKILCDMGKGDELVIADANFPASSLGKRVVRLPGTDSSEFLSAILPFFPVDVEYSKTPALVMDMGDNEGDSNMSIPSTWSDFEKILASEYDELAVHALSNDAFLERAQKAYAIIQTGEERQLGNIILIKGIVL